MPFSLSDAPVSRDGGLVGTTGCTDGDDRSGGGDIVFHTNVSFASLPTTVFEKMSRLAAENQAINLGQGFPDRELEGPMSMKEEVMRSLNVESNQYPPMMGVPSLRDALAEHSMRYVGVSVDASSEVLVTVGATEALAASFLGLLNAGDEVILFAPLYDSYVPMICRAGAKPVVLRLEPPTWALPDLETILSAVNSRTKLIVLNTPHNPTGKVFSESELNVIADVCRRHKHMCVLLDEVYQHLVFPGHRHISLASLPGMSPRCIRIGSAGKTFSFTDFKVGWALGPSSLISALAKAHQFMVFTVNSALQRSVALGLRQESQFYEGLGSLLLEKRNLLAHRLRKIGFDVLPAQGTYFLVVDFSPLRPMLPRNMAEENDVEFCLRLTREARVTLIPVSAFYHDPSAAPTTLVRFVTCKTDSKLEAACDALESYFARLKGTA